ncbi:hypothetical protein L5G32_02610 [Gordonia sp. HY002]|uniref:hypothetical protein n=1 Tax=Gordonia zhenghanii TaxID=2911516 RepID=UPI001EF0CB65|nr:hypothetical protein [Gordonia zhenghanii]MCF8569160.1 hypothetical protein [Gordonia zhenghanii]MCF8604592.1 hypothetical protein [Gordonia zhenghanii]
MQGLAVLLFPPVLMLFALAMEKVQNGLDRLSVGRAHVEEFLDTADETDLSNLAKDGLPAALDELRQRRSNDETGQPVIPADSDARNRAS